MRGIFHAHVLKNLWSNGFLTDYKVVVLGAGGVGKSAITGKFHTVTSSTLTIWPSSLVQFVQGVFIESYDPTIEDSYRKTCDIDSRACTLEILDTAGIEQFTAMRELYIKNGEGFILVYSVTSESSLKELLDLRDQVIRIKGNPNVPMVLVANKTDLESQREVSADLGVRVANSWGRTPYYETSAKYRTNIDEVFSDLVRQIRRRDSAFDSTSFKGHSFEKSIDETSVAHSKHKKHGSNVSNFSIQTATTTPASSIFKLKQRPLSKEVIGNPQLRDSRVPLSPVLLSEEQQQLESQIQNMKFLSEDPVAPPAPLLQLTHKVSHTQLLQHKISRAFTSSKSMPSLRKQAKHKKSAGASKTSNDKCVIC